MQRKNHVGPFGRKSEELQAQTRKMHLVHFQFAGYGSCTQGLNPYLNWILKSKRM